MTDIIPGISLGAFHATTTGLRVAQSKIRYEDWEEYGHTLRRVHGSLRWCIGDWLNYGEEKFGEMASQASDIWPEYSYSNLANMVSVAKAFPISRRRESLGWSLHAEIAKLSLNEQEQWLDELEMGMTRAELRLSLDGRDPIEKAPCPTCGTLVDKGKIR